LLKELLDRVAELAQQADKPSCLESVDPRKKLIRYAGKTESLAIAPPLRNHQAADLASLIAWAQWIDGRNEKEGVACVWHSPGGVVLVMDDEDRRDTVTFPLTLTRAARAIQALGAEDGSRKAWQQRELIRFLRIDLSLPPAIVAPWRKLDWDYSAKTSGLAEHGRDRMGRDVAAAVVGAVDLPEVIAVPVILYEQAGEQETYQVLLSVELAAMEQRIYLAPQPLALENAILAHQQTIGARLLEALGDGARVYFGRP